MSKQDLRPRTIDRFKPVEAVSVQIFEDMPELDQTGQNSEQSDNAAAGKGAPNVVSGFGGAVDGSSARHTQIELLWAAIGAVLQGNNIKALTVLSREREHVAETAALPADRAVKRGFSDHAARRGAHLPEGIEPLKGTPSIQTEDQLLLLVRELVAEQDRERKEVELENKRELNLQKLPPLDPQAPDILNPTISAEAAVKSSLIRRARLRLRRAFIKDTFLACSLSIWFAMAAMVFIDPTLTAALYIMSALLLFVASCLSASECA